MSRSIALPLLVVALGATASAHAAPQVATAVESDANQCLSPAHVLPDDPKKGKTSAHVVNLCASPVDMRICLMTEEKGWNCGMTHNIAPQTSWSWSSSKATGEVFVAARVNGSNRPLNSPPET